MAVFVITVLIRNVARYGCKQVTGDTSMKQFEGEKHYQSYADTRYQRGMH
jgi:hypothetical protein